MVVTLCDVGCAAVSGMIGRGAVFPLDTIKTVSSVTEGGSKVNFAAAVRQIHASDGVVGFYRGLGISAAASAPGVAMYISSYEFASHHLSSVTSWRPLQHLTAGLCAEAVSCVVWVPMDVVKERMQSQHREVAGRYRSSWHGFATLMRLEGLRGMYKGYFSTLGSFGPFSGVYFTAFEAAQARIAATKHDHQNNHHQKSNSNKDNKKKDVAPLSAFETSIAAAIGNIVACIVVNPLEVSKTRYQVYRTVLETAPGQVAQSQQFQQHAMSVNSMFDALKWSVKNEGLLQLWTRGLVARILFQTPSAAITFGTYSHLKNRFCQRQQE